jgi:glutathione S-transferase
MVIKIHGSPKSTCTQRVAVVLSEKQVPYEIVALDFAKAEHKSPAYLQKQPFGQIPVLEDEDGFILYGKNQSDLQKGEKKTAIDDE